jgi:L-arabinose transport system substrate-binding protein
VIATHPEKTAWIIFGSVDNYATGAARAVEGAGKEKDTIMVTVGGENAVKEWANGTGALWNATCFYTAKDFVKPMVEMMLGIIREGKKPEDLFPENKKPGQKYAVVRISGNMVTSANYKGFL